MQNNGIIMKNMLLIFITIGIFLFNKDTFGNSLFVKTFTLAEVIPFFDEDTEAVFFEDLNITNDDVKSVEVNNNLDSDNLSNNENINSENNAPPNNIAVLNLEDLVYQPEPTVSVLDSEITDFITANEIGKLKDINYLKNQFYIVDSKTNVTPEYFDVDKFMAADLKIDNNVEGAKVLIFHTHASEMYANSDGKNLHDGIVGVGAKLKEELENKYGIETMHHIASYDVVNGKGQITGAYERMEPDIRKILKDNPSIQVVLDLHRDGVAETTRLVTNIDGVDYAKFMFVNGICKINSGGNLVNTSGLSSPYIDDNLAFSFNSQLLANSLYPGISRKNYVNAYRYSLHMMPKSLLVEVGAQTNTKEEAQNSMIILAEILANVLL